MDSFKNIESPIHIEKEIHIPASFLHKNYTENVSKYIVDTFEGKYNKEGFIKKDSISNVSIGNIYTSVNNTTGNVRTNVFFDATIIHPTIKGLMNCKITSINNFGVR